MKPNEFLNHLTNKFDVSNADMGNLPHRSRLEKDDETGESILPMPKEVYGDYVQIDDVILFKKASKYQIKLVNLSCKVKKWTSFIREYNSICRQIKSSTHPLSRVIVEVQGLHYLIKNKNKMR